MVLSCNWVNSEGLECIFKDNDGEYMCTGVYFTESVSTDFKEVNEYGKKYSLKPEIVVYEINDD